MKKILISLTLVALYCHDGCARLWSDDAWIGYAYGVDANNKYVLDKELGGLKAYGSAGTMQDSKEAITNQLLSVCNGLANQDKWKKAGVVKCVIDQTNMSGQKTSAIFGPDNPGCLWIFYTEKEGEREMVGITSWGKYPEGSNELTGRDRATNLFKSLASGEHKGAKKCLMCRGLSDCSKQAITNAGVELCLTIHKP